MKCVLCGFCSRRNIPRLPEPASLKVNLRTPDSNGRATSVGPTGPTASPRIHEEALRNSIKTPKCEVPIESESEQPTLDLAITALEKCLQPLWRTHRYFTGMGNALATIINETHQISVLLDELIFGSADEQKLVTHCTEELGCRFNPTELDFYPTKPGQVRSEMNVCTLDATELPKSGWSLLGEARANLLNIHIQLPSRQEFLQIFVDLVRNIHTLPIGTWILDDFPTLSNLEFLQGTATKTRRETDELIEVFIDAEWHPNLKNSYAAVYQLLLRFELLDITLLSETNQHVASVCCTLHGISIRYACDNEALLVSFESSKMKQAKEVIAFDPTGKAALNFDIMPRIRIKELGCGSLKLARIRGTIIYSGSKIVGGVEGECRIVAKITEVGRFPFDTMLRPFLDTDFARKIIITQFYYEVHHQKLTDENWILHSYFKLAMPSVSRALTRCIHSFASHQFKHLDILRLVGDFFVFAGTDMVAKCQSCLGSSKIPCYAPVDAAAPEAQLDQIAVEVEPMRRPSFTLSTYTPTSITVGSAD